MKVEIDLYDEKSKIVKQSNKTTIVKVYGGPFKIWRPYNVRLNQDYWDSDVSTGVTSVGLTSFIAKQFNSLDDYKIAIHISNEYVTAKIHYTLLKQTKDYILVKIDELQI